MTTQITQRLTICNPKGFHARSAAKFVNCATNYNCQVEVSYLDKKVDGTSLIQLMLLSPACGEDIQIFAKGAESSQALKALSELVENGFGELET